MACRKYLISGRVQGVWYRSSTQQQAEQMGLVGQAVNLNDGRVEVVACGDTAALEALESWLWQGPPLAEVTEVSGEPVAEQSFSSFTTG